MQVGERVGRLAAFGSFRLRRLESYPRPKRNVSNGQFSSLQECKSGDRLGKINRRTENAQVWVISGFAVKLEYIGGNDHAREH